MMTPLDMENKRFKKKFFGYNELEVEEFLSEIIENYEKLYKENIEFKEKNSILNENLKHYKSIEETLRNTLISAQGTGEDIKKNAYEKADNTIKEAEIRAGQIVAETNQEITRLAYKYEELKRNYNVFKNKLESICKTQLEILKDIESESSEKLD